MAIRYVSDALQDRSIFDSMLYAVITGIVGVAVGFFLILTGGLFSAFTGEISVALGVVAFLALIWVVLIISAIFIIRSYGEISRRLNIGTFRTADTLYFHGAMLTIILVGFVILLVAYIFQIVAFFSIKEDSAVAQYSQPIQTTGYCPNCGAQVEPGAKFCRNCGKSL